MSEYSIHDVKGLGVVADHLKTVGLISESVSSSFTGINYVNLNSMEVVFSQALYRSTRSHQVVPVDLEHRLVSLHHTANPPCRPVRKMLLSNCGC